MRRDVSLEEISDGRLYDANDMVKADCGGCEGCSECCHGMDDTIELDPLDIYRLQLGLRKESVPPGLQQEAALEWSFEELLKHHIGLHVEDGVILPHLSMSGKEQACTFLNEAGRCRIHAFRPGICRLFPLGRYYENHSFRYFLQVNECVKQNRTKTKVRKWMELPDFAEYEKFVTEWHYFIKQVQERVARFPEQAKTWNMYILDLFFRNPYEEADGFYPEFYRRLAEAKIRMG